MITSPEQNTFYRVFDATLRQRHGIYINHHSRPTGLKRLIVPRPVQNLLHDDGVGGAEQNLVAVLAAEALDGTGVQAEDQGVIECTMLADRTILCSGACIGRMVQSKTNLIRGFNANHVSAITSTAAALRMRASE